MSTSSNFIGIDWTSDGWLAVVFDEHGFEEAIVETYIEDIWNRYQSDSEFVVDIPIGLCSSMDDTDNGCSENEDELYRECDALARKVVGWPRSSSVFTPPARQVASRIADYKSHEQEDKPNFSHQNEELTGKGLAQQAINIAPQIIEVDNLLSDIRDTEAVIEGHPEVCFRAFKESQLEHSKHSAVGLYERLTAMTEMSEYKEGMWQDIVQDLREVDGNPGIDDLIDAIALALTAVGHDQWLFLPPQVTADSGKRPKHRDSENRPMQIVYRAAEPFAEVREYFSD